MMLDDRDTWTYAQPTSMTLAAVLSIGTELTRGELVNGNARWLGERLVELGFTVVEHVSVSDDAERIRGTLLRLGREVQVVVCTGGLGPTSDDLTTVAVADALGVPLVRDPASLAKIEARYRAAKRPMPASNAKQADFPSGARILPNDAGTAPGFALKLGTAQAFFMPGVPREMEHIFDTHVVPTLASLVERRSHQEHVRTYGLFESAVAERLRDLDVGGSEHHPDVTLGYRVTFPEVEVKVLAHAHDYASARELAERVASQVRSRMGDAAYGGKADAYPRYVGRLLKAAKLKVAVAESCTGGLLGKLLTDPPGSSEYVLGGVISYANSVKSHLLGVDAQQLERFGAVSEEVARSMAEGVLRLTDADLAVGVTGIAGPSGGSEQKPVGTVCFALASRSGATLTFTERFPGDRDRVRTFTAYHALRMFAGAAQEVLAVENQTALDAAKDSRVQEA
jgi:nicotinamide-nucleotide amidase